METKWCEDCTFYRKNMAFYSEPLQVEFAYCKHPNSIRSPVSRDSSKAYRLCTTLREDPQACGKEGRWYVPKIPLAVAPAPYATIWPTKWDKTPTQLRYFDEAVMTAADPIEKEGFFKRLFKCLAK